MTVYLSEYQTFTDKLELNHHVSQHIKTTYEYINATDRNIFKFIARYSVKYAGASHLKVATIAEAVGKSVRTVNYVLKRLEDNGMIKRISRMRKKSGGNGANIIQILPFIAEPVAVPVAPRQESVKSVKPTDKPYSYENEPLRKHDLKNNYILETVEKTEETTQASNHPRTLRQSIPQVIYEALVPFFDAEGLYRTYGILLRAKAAVDHNITVEDYGNEYVDVFLNAVRLRKQGKVQKSFEGLLYTSWVRLTAEISRQMKAKSRDSMIRLFEECLSCI